MRSFLSEVVSSLYERWGDDLSSLKVVLPSRRAGLFFSDALSEVALRPLWQPEMVSVGSLMEEIAGVRAGDGIKLVTELYKVYSRYHDESFDSFYFWGEMLLADFNQIDKYLIDADMLFANISDLKMLDRLDYLSSEQIEIITRFWRNFSVGGGDVGGFSEEKERFWAIWSTLADIYHEFNAELLRQGLAYEGMVHRMAAEKLRSGEVVTLGGGTGVTGSTCGDSGKTGRSGNGGNGGEGREIYNGGNRGEGAECKYVIAGFNALSECEKRLFAWLDKSGRAEFFWDYDDYYVGNPDHEAGLFLRENIRQFPALNADRITYNHFVEPKEIVAVSAPSDSMQCKYVYTFLQGIIDKGITPGKETAIVLTDETLLSAVLHSIPEGIASVNVTMGSPLRQTTVYSFLERLLALQAHKKISAGGQLSFFHLDVTGLVNHPYIQEFTRMDGVDMAAKIEVSGRAYIPSDMVSIEGISEHIFKSTAGWQELSQYLKNALSVIGSREAAGESTRRRRELFALVIDNLSQVENSLSESGLQLSNSVYSSLLRRVLQGVRIPYQGEPLEGIQVMGILETRNLDFENVLLLSANDDTFPGNSAVTSSFIPYNLRYAYGLPTPQHHDGVYGYYFYRLVQRASTVHIAYSSLSDDKHTGEPSRYIYQLEYESRHKVLKKEIPLSVNLSSDDENIVIPKSDKVAAEILRYKESGGGRALSPTAFSTYLECPLKFYFKYIARIAPEKEVSEEIDMPMFGTILHKAMELLYAPLAGIARPKPKIEAMIASEEVEKAVDEALRTEYLHDEKVAEDDYSGEMLLVKDIVIRYIKGGILRYDASPDSPDFVVSALEHKVESVFNGVAFRGIADRMDILDDGTIRVVDYKTGARKVEFADIESLFSEESSLRAPAVLQTLLYSLMMWQSEKRDVCPALYHVRYMNDQGFSPLLMHGGEPVMRFSDYREGLEAELKRVLGEMFDLSRPFGQCSDVKTCEYCDFKAICRR